MMRSRYSIFGIWLIPSSYRIESNEIKFKSSLFFLFCSGFISLVLSFFLFLFFDFFCFVTQRTGSHHTTYIFLLNSLFLSYIHIHIHIHTHTYYIILYYIIGTPVPQIKIDEILIELRKWTTQTGLINKNRERPSIKANNYMILRKPTKNENDNNGDKKSNKSRREIRKAKKQERYKHIWDIAINALQDVDPIYANERCTEIAVTYGFKGSPHRDKQNCGPFYGLSMGNFNSGGGGIMVESSARTCVNINTHNKLGKIDGRYVHWVDEWDNTNMNTDDTNDTTGNANNNNNNNNNAGPAGPTTVERYSLIYYETGNNFIKPGPAVFSIPKDIKR
jgi:hypothetical protein